MEQNSALLPSLGNATHDIPEEPCESSSRPFIEANTIPATLDEIKRRHIIPVFTKDNEPLISHADFIDSVESIVSDLYQGERILKPAIRLSHPVKGRVPEAKDKPAIQLLESEKTIYFERMAFVIELPGITEQISGNTLSLTVGGVKAYNQDNLYSRSVCDQHFKVFIGFKNSVCTNLCVFSDGAMLDLKVKNLGQLRASIYSLLQGYNANYHLFHLRKLNEYCLHEQQFANLIGRCRMYNHLPNLIKADIPVLQFNDTQISSVCKDYYRDNSFCRSDSGAINLWRLYNLFTGSNKSSYIDNFLDRSVNAFNLVDHIRRSLDEGSESWYLN